MMDSINTTIGNSVIQDKVTNFEEIFIKYKIELKLFETSEKNATQYFWGTLMIFWGTYGGHVLRHNFFQSKFEAISANNFF